MTTAVGMIVTGVSGSNPDAASKEKVVIDGEMSVSTFEKADERCRSDSDGSTLDPLFTMKFLTNDGLKYADAGVVEAPEMQRTVHLAAD